LNAVPVGQLNYDLITAFPGVCAAMTWWFGKGEEDDKEKKWELMKKIIMKRSGKFCGMHS
jgi:hypothetical protein